MPEKPIDLGERLKIAPLNGKPGRRAQNTVFLVEKYCLHLIPRNGNLLENGDIVKDLPAKEKNGKKNMDLKSFRSIFRGETSLKRYLIKACWKDDARFCIRCRTKKIYRIRRDRYRCSQCDYEFSDFTGRWINKVKLPPQDWLWLIKLFEVEVSARRVSQQLGISYPTVHKAFHLIRQSITAHSENADSMLDEEVETKGIHFENHPEGRRAEDSKPAFPVFGILESNGLVKVEPLRGLNAEAGLNLIEAAGRGSIVNTNGWKTYTALIFDGRKYLTVDHREQSGPARVCTNGVDGFWNYAKGRLNKFHGISNERFPLYLKEMEFRYNHRDESIFNILVWYLCDLTEI